MIRSFNKSCGSSHRKIYISNNAPNSFTELPLFHNQYFRPASLFAEQGDFLLYNNNDPQLLHRSCGFLRACFSPSVLSIVSQAYNEKRNAPAHSQMHSIYFTVLLSPVLPKLLPLRRYPVCNTEVGFGGQFPVLPAACP